MRDYTKIEAWRLADDLTVAVYERTRSLPREEMYGLTSQLRRAAYSVPANIVLSGSPFPSPNPDNAHRQRLLVEPLHRYARDLCW